MKITMQHALSAVLASALVFAPLAAEAQQPPATQADAAQPTAQQSQTGTTINPAQGPLEPVPAQDQLPETPQAQQAPAKPVPQTQNQTEPLGTATAPGVSTVGGGASRPAGTAIAPAKQKQYHSLLVKLGLIAAGGAALGTVYALSRGTSSTPPGATRAAAGH